MELKRVIDKHTISILLVVTAIVCILFYKQQIQNGTQEILTYNKDYSQNQYTIFDVNTMYEDMLTQYTQDNDVTNEYSQDHCNQFMIKYYQDNIDKSSIQFPIYKMARTLLQDQIQYVASYQSDIKEMRENALETIKVGAFSNPSSYAYNNILKTRYDMRNNENIKLTLCNTRALESIYQYKLPGYFIIFLMVYLCHRYVEERKNGLWHIIHTASAGRRRLVLRRSGILLLASVLFSVVINCAIYIESFSLYGGLDNLWGAIQSGRQFSYMIIHSTGLGYLVLNILLQAVTAYVMSLLIWSLITLFNSQIFASGLFIVILAIEYLAYQYVPVTGTLGMLKYANIIQLINPMDAIVEYTNCGVGSFLLSRQEILFFELLFFVCVGVVIIQIISERKYPVQEFSKCRKWLDKISKRYNSLVSKLPAYGTELYKILIIQKGIIVIVVAVGLIMGIKLYGSVYYDAGRDILRNYYNEVGGYAVNDSVYSQVSQYEVELAEKKSEYQNLDSALQDGQNINYSYMRNLGDEITALEDAVSTMQQQIAYLDDLKNERGIEAEVISTFSYDNVLGGSLDYSQNMINLYLFLVMIFLLNANFAYERKGKMIPIIRSCAEGRERFIRRKLGINVLLTVLLWAGVYGRYIYQVSHMYDLNNLNCSVLSLSMMEHFPINISIKTYIILSLLLKLFVMLMAMLVITMISLVISDKFTMIVSLILLIPHMLYVLGFQQFQYLSLVLPMNNWQMERIYKGNWGMYIIYLCVFLFGMAALFIIGRSWTRSRKIGCR